MRSVLLSVGALLAGAQASAAPCTPPPPVASYLAGHPGWTILDMPDLLTDDRLSWRQSHNGQCPGLTRVVLDGSGRVSFGLALVDRDNGLEQVVALMAQAKGFRAYVLEPPVNAVGAVVYRAPPGSAADEEAHVKVKIAHDSIVWEQMEAASRQFYFAGGEFHAIQTGD
ncbi:MAG TPA: hypothetical protein VG889_21370 [Rhizomicrobium sp.]|nr:hypothetical protein [Rhizomicrobium sp.]